MPALLTPPPITAATRREFLALLGAGGLLTACGSSDAAPVDPATEPIVGGYGPVDVPIAPQRVLTMINNDTDRALVLGLPLIGAYASATGAPFPGYQAARLVGVPSVGTYDLNIEEIAALAPDLVVYGEVGGYLDRTQYDALSGIAPVYSFDPALAAGYEWRPQLRAMASTFGRDGSAEQFVSAYDDRAAELAGRVRERWAGASMAYVAPSGPDAFYIAQQTMQTNVTLLTDLGLAPSSAVPATVETRRLDVSFEELGMLSDADILLIRTNPRPGTAEVDVSAVEQITTAQLWATLPAVQAGNVFTIPGDLFYPSPLTAEANLDWAEANLLTG